MVDLANAIGGLEKLNNIYNLWQKCVEWYLQGQDLWEVVGDSEIIAPAPKNGEALRKWRIKAAKTMFASNTTVQKAMLFYFLVEHITGRPTLQTEPRTR